jgi:3-methyl-2-oxobutanoate hydroxymethyltransferase
MLRVPDLPVKKARGEKIVMLTAYDAWMARLLAATGAVDLLLVGDSLGMIELGYDTTVPVTVADVARHSRAVRAGAPQALIVADMPFLSHQVSPAQALRNAATLIQKGRATAVKVEGAGSVPATVKQIVEAGIPVMGHLGLQPQHVHAQGGFRRQAKRPEEQRLLLEHAQALEQAGAFAIVLECVPDEAALDVTRVLHIPTIGIGSGPNCDGQVLVTHDILGLSGAITPPFAKQYASLGEQITAAVEKYSREVRSGEFPARPARQTSHA